MSLPDTVLPTAPAPTGRRETVVVSGLSSDAHTWNLVFLQLLVEELGYDVVNLGPTVPDALLEAEILAHDPVLVVISSVNGHGHQDGLRVIRRLRAVPALAATPMVIGGKLGISGGEDDAPLDELVAAGFDAVFEDGRTELGSFERFIGALPQRALT
ncbi:cobalamin B12-binding domain-containing protein [Streptomyces filamentosus]|uniref:Methylaspartate mutase n=1 Tax=Streptomyces filamentosus TaxID=67294 RepID=A0A919BAJ8_STRFL|nr:cobalamin-dependent protein [Streptomyces filamentosus]GHF79029.1 methylaspartate mutase [Streptomyces filamentosus]